nr:DUF4244 domain-containing protein [Streptomyces termitum]
MANRVNGMKRANGGVWNRVRASTGAFWRSRRAGMRTDDGMSTAEYALGTIAAAAFAAVLYKVVTSGSVAGALESVISKALHAPF